MSVSSIGGLPPYTREASSAGAGRRRAPSSVETDDGGLPLQGGQRARSPQEAAKQFEEVLVREFVRTMTKGLFEEGLGGEDTAGWVKAQGSAQTDALTDAVTRHLVDSGQLGISELLLAKWGSQEATGRIPGDALPLDAPQRSPDGLSTGQFLSLRKAAFLDGDEHE